MTKVGILRPMKSILPKIAALLIGAVLPSMAVAADMTANATPPTQYTNNDPVATTGPEALKLLRFEYGTCNGAAFGVKAGEKSATLPATSVTWTGLNPGTYCVQAFAQLANGTESLASNVKPVTLASRVPMPPVLTATTGVAYTVIKQIDRFVMLPVGTVPVTTTCDQSQSVNGYNVIPRAAVQWSGNVRPDVVVAQCS